MKRKTISQRATWALAVLVLVTLIVLSTQPTDSLKRRGLMVCVGTASGPIEGFSPNLLAMKGSLYLTRPALADYIADPAEKAELAAEVFGHVAAGRIRIDIHQRYALGDAQQAHRDLESRQTTGSSVFVI